MPKLNEKPKKLTVYRTLWPTPKTEYGDGSGRLVTAAGYAECRKYARANGYAGIRVEWK